MAPQYSDLEVTPNSGAERYYEAGLEHDSVAPAPISKYDASGAHIDSDKEVGASQNRRICGLAPKTFWIVAIIAIVVVIGAAVGGGVGGSVASKSGKNTESSPASSVTSAVAISSTSAQSSSSSQATTPSSTTSVALTTTQVIGPTYTLLRDCPSSNNTLYGVTLGSVAMNFRKVCGKSFLNSLVGQHGEDSVNQKAASLDSCINLCAAYNVQNATGIAAGQNSVCNAVCWRNSLDDDDFPGQCFGFTTQNSSNAFVVSTEGRCDSAAWIDQKIL